MRITPALLCISLIFSLAAAADPFALSPTDTYLAARGRFIATFKGHTDAADKRVLEARAAVERLLRAAVPAWSAPGFPATATINLGVYDDPDTMGLGVLNGLVYSAGDTSVVVTNRALVTRWLGDHNAGRDRPPVPGAIPGAFRSDHFWTFALATDAAAQLRGLVLVKAPAGTDVAMAQLAVFAQYVATDRDADTLLVAVIRGDRVFVARQKLAVALVRPAVCKKPLDQTLAKSAAALKDYQESVKDPAKAKDVARFNDHLALDERADREYRACFAQHLREQPDYAAIQKQAQMLVDLLR